MPRMRDRQFRGQTREQLVACADHNRICARPRSRRGKAATAVGSVREHDMIARLRGGQGRRKLRGVGDVHRTKRSRIFAAPRSARYLHVNLAAGSRRSARDRESRRPVARIRSRRDVQFPDVHRCRGDRSRDAAGSGQRWRVVGVVSLCRNIIRHGGALHLRPLQRQGHHRDVRRRAVHELRDAIAAPRLRAVTRFAQGALGGREIGADGDESDLPVPHGSRAEPANRELPGRKLDRTAHRDIRLGAAIGLPHAPGPCRAVELAVNVEFRQRPAPPLEDQMLPRCAVHIRSAFVAHRPVLGAIVDPQIHRPDVRGTAPVSGGIVPDHQPMCPVPGVIRSLIDDPAI